MASTPVPLLEPLPPEIAARLTEFAKACRAAARIVSMYPSTHPAIQAALARIGEAAKQATSDGPFAVTVLPDCLMVGGRGLPKPEMAVSELADMLHLHGIGAITLAGDLDVAAWHTFLTLLAKPPDEVRAAGGLALAWQQSGTSAITMQAIDYSQVLRERSGGGGEGVTWDRILGLLGGESTDVMDTLIAMADDPAQLAQFAQKLQDEVKALGDDPSQQRKALLDMMHGLARHASAHAPDKLETVLEHITDAVTRLSPEMLLALMTEPAPGPTPSAPDVTIDLPGEVKARASDEMVSNFLVANVAKDRGATSRLAAAFTALVPDAARQADILGKAAEQAAQLFPQDPQFESVWNSSSEMLSSYSDEQFVSEGYARELTAAQSQAVDIDKIGDDPPDRIRAWLSTLGEEEVRALDQRVLLDLLRIEKRPDAWSQVLDLAVDDINDLVLVGDLPLAAELLEAVVSASNHADEQFTTSGTAAIKRLVEGPLVRHLSVFLRQANDSEVSLANQMCKTIGPTLVEPLAQALMAEDNPRTVRRLRDILIGFGPAAREYANKLRSSPNTAVRRAAVDLLRALGGDAALPDLRRMLDDPDPPVQREALRGIVQIGTNEAYQALEQALQSGEAHTRMAIMQALGALRDQRAAPLFTYMVINTDYRGNLEPVYISAIEALGRLADDDKAVSALETVLHRGEFWSPGRTSRIRRAAARALNSIGTAAAQLVLTSAANHGPRGVRRAARAALAEPSTRMRKAP